MIDGVLAVVSGYVCWCRKFPFDGLPIMFLVFAIPWYLRFFPAQCYVYTFPSGVEVAKMVVITDLLQTVLHAATHKGYLGHFVYASHMVHHTKKKPVPADAFVTGTLDALLQLVIPVIASIFLTPPSRISLILFGCIYSQWLLFIHTSVDLPCMKWLLVTPAHHQKHHRNPGCNFANVFVFLDPSVIKKN